MGTVSEAVKVHRLPASDALDPITIYVWDYEQGKGNLIVECYGQAWSAWWHAMGRDNIASFIARCDPDYVANNMRGPLQMTNGEEKYLLRVATAVRDYFASRSNEETATTSAVELNQAQAG